MFKHSYAASAVVFFIDWVLSVLVSLVAVLLLRWITYPIAYYNLHVLRWMVAASAVSFLAILVTKEYRVVLRYASLKSVSRCVMAVLFKEAVLLVLLLLGWVTFPSWKYLLFLLVSDCTMNFVVLVMLRIFVSLLLDNGRHSIEEDMARMSVLVCDVSDKSVALITRLAASPRYHVMGFVTADASLAGKYIQDYKIFHVQSREDFERLYATVGGIDAILFSRDNETKEQQELVHVCMELGVHVLVAPRIDEIRYDGAMRKAPEKVAEKLEYIPDGMSGFERHVKRLVDCVIAALLLVVFSPLMLICWVLVRREDHGPAIYKQERIGRFGRPFYIYKFRTMRVDAEKMGPALYSGDKDLRLTRIGSFLRQHHLDELPQLYNVFTGDMAFIGWRPERQFYIDQIVAVDPRYTFLYQIRPGVTSYATLYNGYTDTLEKMLRRLEYDLYYLKNRSWWFDLKVLWLTFANIAFGKKF